MFLAVAPSLHGNGIGTDLLRHGFDRVDHAGGAAYLEAASAALCRLYARHGFTARDPITLPDDGPHLYPMLRPAH
jgi:predicted N-acetyltransferase YhbS